ncbi:GntR family transcriptional regulator [Martelella lutilitoris]|uniref:GntR family transcriptional regulator n=1 Tax=Martelella lutilitoris TaxID=2583532 RepID=A0A5C4JVY1_9HYPH|nr:GntR family transcriptional regulator [Martelella lutilitoris]TNB49414.1 GntR family transcriptional regulator [Martelella lutilitoris]
MPSGMPSRSNMALHRRISEQILTDVENGRWLPGDQLPSEDQLASEMNASLGTVQRALRSLVQMGVVERHHGRGTFVSGARALEEQLQHFRFHAEGSDKLLPVYFKIISVEETSETGPWSHFLDEDDPNFLHISRIVSVNDEFEVYSEIYLPAGRFADIARMSEKTLNGVSFRDLLAERFNAPTLNTRQTMSCQPLPPRVARRLAVPAGQYGLVWTICGMSYRDAPITWQRIFVPPSDRVIEIGSFSPKNANSNKNSA